MVGLVAGLLLLGAGPALADAVPVKIGKIRGPGWSRVRAAVQRSLASHDEVQLVRDGEAAVVTGAIKKAKAGLIATLEVSDGAGATVGSAVFRAKTKKGIADRVQKSFWSELGPALRGLAPEPAPVAELEPPPPPAEATAAPAAERPAAERRAPEGRQRASREPARRGGPSGLAGEKFRFSMGVGVFSRQLGWADDLFQQLASYELGAAPAFRLGATWFPGAHFTDGPLAWIGLESEAELPFAVESEREGVSFPTSASAWRLGALFRLPTEVFEARLGVGLAERRFHLEVSDEGTTIADLPEVRYQSLSTRLGFTVRIFDLIDVEAHGGWGFMLDAGPIGRSQWFPDSASHTASAGGGLEVTIAPGLAAFGRFDWQGAFFDFSPEPGDARVAGGASDMYYLTSIGFAFRG